MKVLKIIVGIIVVVVGLFFAWLAMQPDSYRVERSTVINASPELIMDNIAKFKNWSNWSPWAEKDPNAVYTFDGTDGEVGAKMSWDGNDSIGMGSMTISAINGAESMSYDLAFIKPWESSSAGVFTLSADEGGTKVTWVDEGDLPFFMRMMASAMDGFIGPDFERGLSKMKAHVEGLSANAAPSFDIEEIVVEAYPYLAITDSCSVDMIGTKLGEWYGAIMAHCGEKNITPAGQPFAMYHSWDGSATRMTAGIPLSESAEGTDLIESGTMYAGSALKITYVGPYEGSEAAHMALNSYIENNGKEYAGSPWEVYVNDPMEVKDPNELITEIYYPIK